MIIRKSEKLFLVYSLIENVFKVRNKPKIKYDNIINSKRNKILKNTSKYFLKIKK